MVVILQFTIVPEKIKYLRISLTIEMRDLYKENYKTLHQEIKDMIKMETFSFRLLMDWRINSIKMAIFCKALYRFNAFPIRMPLTFFKEIDQ